MGWSGRAWEASAQDWAWVLGGNLHGVINGFSAFLPRMIDQGVEGHIVNTSSMAGLAGPPGLSLYATSKHAVVRLSESLRHDLIAANIPIGLTVACPGLVNTGIANAERHRPARHANPTKLDGQTAPPPPPPLPPVDPADPSLGVLTPIEATVVADILLDAVVTNRFLALTHLPAAEHLLRSHLDSLLACLTAPVLAGHPERLRAVGAIASAIVSGYPDGMGVIVADELPADPLDALRALTRTEAELDELRRQQVAAARDAGATWEQVGEALGMSRQSAWEYYAARSRFEIAANAAANADLSEDDAMGLAVDEVRALRRRRRAR